MGSVFNKQIEQPSDVSSSSRTHGKSRRRNPRVPTDFEVRLQWEAATHPARCTSLSLGGMFVETGLRLGYDAHVALEFSVRGGREIVHLEGTVRWFDARGFGIQFDRMGARETHALSVLVEETRQALAERGA